MLGKRYGEASDDGLDERQVLLDEAVFEGATMAGLDVLAPDVAGYGAAFTGGRRICKAWSAHDLVVLGAGVNLEVANCVRRSIMEAFRLLSHARPHQRNKSPVRYALRQACQRMDGQAFSFNQLKAKPIPNPKRPPISSNDFI